MKWIAIVLTAFLTIGCTKGEETVLGGEMLEERFFTVTNGHSSLNLYPYGSIGLAPGETSSPYKIQGKDVFHFKYKWSDDLDNTITITVDLSDRQPNSTSNFSLTK